MAAKDAVYTKAGDKWTSGGKTMDSTGVQALIDKLRDLSATKFVDSGFTTPELAITVVSNDGKRTEKVEIAAAGANFIGAPGWRAVHAYQIDGERDQGSARRPSMSKSSRQDRPEEIVPIGLLTDLYQLTMAAGYFEAGKTGERATFELFVRRLPHESQLSFWRRGLQQAVDYLLNLRFTARGNRVSARASAVRANQHRILRYAGRAALHGRPVRRRRRHAAVRGRAVS